MNEYLQNGRINTYKKTIADILVEQTKTRSQKTVDQWTQIQKVNKSMVTFCLIDALNLEERKWMLGLSSLGVHESVFNETKGNKMLFSTNAH